MGATEELPRKGSRWTYEGAAIVVDGVRSIVDWHYETPPTNSHPSDYSFSGELKCFQEGNKRQKFFPAPIRVEAGQTWVYNWGEDGGLEFVVGEVFEDVAYGRKCDGSNVWFAVHYNLSYLITSKYWTLKED